MSKREHKQEQASGGSGFRGGVELRQKRSSAFWRWIAPYLRDVAGSLPGMIALGSLGMYLYRSFLTDMPEGFPVAEVLTVLLGLAAAWTPIRTYVREPDRVYVMPAEPGMDGYFRGAVRAAFVWQAVVLVAAAWIAWPLYRAGDGSSAYWTVAAALIVLKGLNAFAAWQEAQLRERRHRLVFGAARTGVTLAGVYAFLSQAMPVALIVVGVLYIGLIALLRLPPRHRIGWERLIELERRHRLRWVSVLNQFTDVPREEADVRRRGGLGRLAGRLPFRPMYAYDYLYTLTWLRSELSGMTVRMTVLAAVLLAALDGDWQRAAVYAAAALLIGRQLSELGAFHRGAGFGPTLPLTAERRHVSLRRVALVLQAAVLTALAVVGAAAGWSLLWTAATWVIALALSYGYMRRLGVRERV